MRKFAILLSALLTISLLSGCYMTSPKDEEFRRDWNEAMEEAREDLEEGLEEGWSGLLDGLSGAADSIAGKKHRWKVLDADGEELFTVTDAGTVKTLDGFLSDGGQHTEKDPGNPLYTYVYSQEKTLLAGQDPNAEREYEDLVSFTVSASEDAVTLTILEDLPELGFLDLSGLLTETITIPAETAEALRNPSQFSE